MRVAVSFSITGATLATFISRLQMVHGLRSRHQSFRWIARAILVWALGVVSFAFAQGLFGAISEAFVDTVNTAAGIEPDDTVRRLQIDAVAVAVRGSEEDWERFLNSTINVADGIAGGSSTEQLLEQTRFAAGSLAWSDANSPAWNPPTFSALQVSGLGTVPARVVETAFSHPPAMRDWRVESIAYGPIDTTGVDRMIALLSAVPPDAPPDVPGSAYNDWGRRLYLFVFAAEALDTVIAATKIPGGCYAYGSDLLMRLPNGLGPLTLVDLDGDGRQEMIFTSVCRIGYLQNGFYEPGAAQYDLIMEIARFELHDRSVRMLSHAGMQDADPNLEDDPIDWVAAAEVVNFEGLGTVGRWADAPHDFNPGVLFHSRIWVERGSNHDALVVERYHFDVGSSSPVLRPMQRGQPDIPLEGGDHVWTKRFWLEPSGAPVLEVLAGAGRAVVDDFSPWFIDAIQQRQEIGIDGSGFGEDTEVVVWADDKSFVIPPERRRVLSPRRMVLTVGLFPAEHDWRVAVRNPGDDRWSEVRLRVVPPRAD